MSLFSTNLGPQLGGIRIVTSLALVDPCEDFSRSRSPSRALRLWRKRGIRGRGVFERPSRKVLHIPAENMIVCHPAVYRDIVRKLQP